MAVRSGHRWGHAVTERYQPAEFVSRSKNGDWLLRLEEPLDGSDRVCVRHRNIKYRREPKSGAQLCVFLTGQSARNWFGEVWGRDENPWLTGDMPKSGELVYGTVVRMPSEQFAVVELDEPPCPFAIEAQLHSDRLPSGAKRPINASLDIGDRVAAVVASVIARHLEIRLDVQAALSRLRAETERNKFADHLVGESRRASSKSTGESGAAESATVASTRTEKLAGRSLIVFGADETSTNLLCAWVERYGANAKGSSDLTRLQQLLKSASQPLVLVDLHGVPYEAAIETTRVSGGTPVLWSAHVEAEEVAKKLGVAFEPKPTRLKRIMHLIMGETLPRNGAHDRLLPGGKSQLWTGYRTASIATREAEDYLAKLCQRYNLLGAIWLRRDREAVLSMQALWGPFETGVILRVVPRLLWSAVTAAVAALDAGWTFDPPSATDDSRPDSGHVPPLDPAADLFPPKLRDGLHFCAFRLLERDAKPHIVVLFHTAPFVDRLLSELQYEFDHMRHLLQLFRITEHVDSTETFATVGRAFAVTLHELRNRAQELELFPARILAELARAKLDVAADETRQLEDGLRNFVTIATADLCQISKFRTEELDVNHVVDKAAKRMRVFRKSVHPQSQTGIAIRLDEQLNDLKLPISPIVLEQPLVNLIDYACHHTSGEVWGRIEVETRLTDDAETPLHIYVRHNGQGLTAAEVTETFEPGTMRRGANMGLYASRNVLRAAGGELECFERLRWLGATFCIRLPVLLGGARVDRNET